MNLMNQVNKWHYFIQIFTTIWPLSTLPNLELCLSSNKSPTSLKKQNQLSRLLKIKQFLRKYDKCMVQIFESTSKVTLTTILKSSHDHETSSKHKTHVIHSKATRVQLWITPNTLLHKWIKNNMGDLTHTQQSC